MATNGDTKPIRVGTLFSGYDSQCLALNRLGISYELDFWCEIDKHAITAHNALFPQWKDRNLGDVSKVDWTEWHKQHPQQIDLLTYSSPCQDFSSAGLQRGGEEGSGTRSGLLWETERAVRELRPRHLVFENVGGLVSDKFIDLFNRWQARLNSYGYTNFSQLMNAKDYGVPQNRLRIFMVSILDCQRAYYFPKPFKLERRLKDVLEQNVEERYYLSDERVQKLMQETKIHSERGNGFAFKPHTPEEIAGTVKCSGIDDKTDNHVAEPQDNVMLGWTRSNTGKGDPTYHPVKVANCVTAAKRDNTQNYVMEPTIASMKSRDKDNPTGVRTANNGNFAQRIEPSADQSTSNTITSVAKDNLLIEPKNINNEQTRVFTDINEANTREALRLLWQEVGTQTFCEKMGRLGRFQETQVLQQGVHEEGFCENGHDNTEQRHGSQLGETHSVDRGEQGKSVCGVREEGWQTGCASQGRKLEEQFLGEFNDCLSQLPHETPQAEECMRYLRQADGRWTWLLQQTLSTLEEIRQSTDGERKNCQGIRIRRLSERELYRLMDLEEKDIDTLLAAPIPRTQHAKLAGNSIVVACLYYIFRNIFVDTEPAAGTQTTLF